MKIGIAQLNPIIGDLPGNSEKILAAAQEFASQDVNLMLTPELSLCGYPPRDLLMDLGFIQEMAIALKTLAQKLPPKLATLIGTVEFNPNAHLQGGKPLFNSAALLHQGKIQKIFHKRLLPTYDVFDEDRYFEPGAIANWFDLKDLDSAFLASSLRVGVTICEDVWNDEKFWGKRSYLVNPVADLAEQQVDLLINLSASPYAVGKQKLRAQMLKHSAIANNLPLIYANQVGANDDLIFDGSSMAFNRKGEQIALGKAWQVDNLILEFDSSQKDFTFSKCLVMQEPREEAEIWQALVLGVKDYAGKCGFKQAVIGLSGGIDSALVAAIATQALAKENVLGVLMPSPYSSEHSISDAIALAENLGVSTQTIPIQAMMLAFEQSLANLFLGTDSDITEENLQSRIRGSLLMAISNKFGHLLLSTGNKSEIAVGYCTLYGDMNGGLAVIADLPKTKVYALCQWLNHQTENLIPSHILTKAPSAELRPGQLDQDSLPDYDILDQILEKIISDRSSRQQIIQAGFIPEVVDRIIKLVTRAEFKRRQAPPGLKISDRAFGSGWRMPIASKRSS